MAAHPDQVFVNGTQLRQVASPGGGRPPARSSSTRRPPASTSARNPTGRNVRGTTLAEAISIRAADTVIRGIGVRRYAPSIWHIGAVTLERPNGRARERRHRGHRHHRPRASPPPTSVVRGSSVLRSGLLGVHAGTADRLQLVLSRIDGNNWERFNSAPVSGGMKAGRLARHHR